MDDSLLQTNTAPTDTISNLDHLEGRTVGVVADDIVLPERTVSGGQITLTESEEQYTNIEVGIKFTPRFKGMPLNTNVGSGQNQMRLKKILRTNVRVKDTLGLKYNGNLIPSRSFGEGSENPLDSAPPQFTGVIEDLYDTNGWGRLDDMPEFTVEDPTPCTILAVEYEVESS